MVLPQWKTVQWFLKKLQIELPYNPAIVFLHIYPKELKARSQRDICTLMFKSAKMWKQPKCPSTNEWIKKMWYIHTLGYYSALKRKEILTHAMIRMMWYDWESVCQRRGQGFGPWSGKISLAAEQLRPCATTTEPTRSNYWIPPPPPESSWFVTRKVTAIRSPCRVQLEIIPCSLQIEKAYAHQWRPSTAKNKGTTTTKKKTTHVV